MRKRKRMRRAERGVTYRGSFGEWIWGLEECNTVVLSVHSHPGLRTTAPHPDMECIGKLQRAAKRLPRVLALLKGHELDKATECRNDFMRRVQALPYPPFIRSRVAADGRCAMERWRQAGRPVATELGGATRTRTEIQL